jgi:hypothetical protein
MQSIILVLVVGILAVASQTTSNRLSVKSYELIHTVPHDTSCFTQGLEFYNGLLYERYYLLLSYQHPFLFLFVCDIMFLSGTVTSPALA